MFLRQAIQWNSVESTDVVDSRSFGDPLTKHELLYVLSLPKDETFISPDKHIELTKFGADFFQRHGYPYSGRSFSKGFLHKEKLYEFVIKGGHLLRDGEIYYPNKQIWASPAWGCETVQQSYNEFIAARDIQSLYLQVFWELAPIPVPLKVSRLDTYRYENDINDYKLMFAYVAGSNEFYQNNVFNFMINEGLEICYEDPAKPWKRLIKKEFTTIDQILDLYRAHIGNHGSYQYICEWTTMRLADVFKAPTKIEMQERIRSFYPGCSDEKICEIFMSNFWKAQWAIRWSWYQYNPENISGCYLVDTTIMGHTMDIDWYTFHHNVSEEQAVNIFKTSWAYAEMSHLFYRLFFSQDFLEFYNKHFIQTFAETYAKIFIFRTKQANGKAYESLVQALVGSFQAQAELQISINRDEKKFRSTPKYLGNILEVTGLGKVTEVIGYGE